MLNLHASKTQKGVLLKGVLRNPTPALYSLVAHPALKSVGSPSAAVSGNGPVVLTGLSPAVGKVRRRELDPGLKAPLPGENF